MKNLTATTKLTKSDLIARITKLDSNVKTAKLTQLELVKVFCDLKNHASATNEITIRSQKVSPKFQRFMIVANMLKDGNTRLEILERLMSENGIYAGVNKAMSEKSTKNFIGKVTACFNGLMIGGSGKVAAEMSRLAKGNDVSKGCTFKSYARLTYKALQ